MKIATWNIEWMNRWFTGDSNPQWGSRYFTADEAKIQAQKAANVINILDADLLCIQEGPTSEKEMQLFIDNFLSNGDGSPKYKGLVGADGRSKKLYSLCKADSNITSCDYALDDLTLALAEDWDVDVTGDLLLESYEFSRLPLVVDVGLKGGQSLRVVVMHVSAKYAARGEAKWSNMLNRQEFIVEALRARRRISAEAFRLRSYLDELISSRQNQHIVVLGDFNDGPGPDFFERAYLTHNVTDILLGSTFHPNLIFDHPVLRLRNVPAKSLFSARFDDYIDKIQDRPLLLDHILVSPQLSSFVKESGIAHRAFELQVEDTGAQRALRPSNHRPVWISLKEEW